MPKGGSSLDGYNRCELADLAGDAILVARPRARRPKMSTANSSLYIFFAAMLISLSACSGGPVPLYQGTERSIEQTAVIKNLEASDHVGVTGTLNGRINLVDGFDPTVGVGINFFDALHKSIHGPRNKHNTTSNLKFGDSRALLPGMHVFRVWWGYNNNCEMDSNVLNPLGNPRFAAAVILLPFALVICGVDDAVVFNYGNGSRIIRGALDAGEEYRFHIRGVEGMVFVWIEEEETGRVVGGESPTDKSPYIEVAMQGPVLPEDEFERIQAAHKARIERLAHEGDPDAMYEYANHLHIGAGLERIEWYCRAGHAGHAKARFQLARYHHHGFVLEKDAEQAFVWYTLSLEAENNSEVAGQRDRLFENMTSAQVAEVKRLVADWASNPAECEEIPSQADK